MYFYERDDYKEAKKQLKGEYAVCYQKAANYIHAFSSNPQQEESCLMQLLDDFLSAQMEGKPISRITGPDMRKFCETLMKAEFDRMVNRAWYYVMSISAFIFLAMFHCFAKGCLLDGKKITLKNLNNLQINSFILLVILLLILYYILKKLLSRLFFKYMKILGGIIRFQFILYCFIISVAFSWKERIGLAVRLPFPLFILLIVGSLTAFVIACIQDREHRRSYQVLPETAYDMPGQVTCPVCGKEHDFDYPRCPFCKHKYIM